MTAEAALVLPVLVLVLGVAVGTIGAVAAQLRCIDAAREAARAVARGESTATAQGLATRAGPAGAVVVIAAGEDRIDVTVSATVEVIGGLIPPVDVSGRATAVPEPGAVATTRSPVAVRAPPNTSRIDGAARGVSAPNDAGRGPPGVPAAGRGSAPTAVGSSTPCC